MKQRLIPTHFIEICKDNTTSILIESGIHPIKLLGLSLDLSKICNKKTLFIWKIKYK